ncbi:MAG: 2-oxoacid:acceptor oxidoreductase subunit alpha [Candidatus Levybacteria bacterium]|nr:2-oxoacid:acceptor oxidoreductase subunit alpha [Candidatus Levybacteria bacterium]
MIDLEWLIGGEAGYGIMTTGMMMSKVFTRLGFSVFDYVEYPSLIRGGHNAYYVRASDAPITAQKRTVDMLVALNSQTVKLHTHELSENSAIIYDPNVQHLKVDDFPEPVKLFPIPLFEITKQLQVDRLMINTVSVGASLALFHNDFSLLEKMMQDAFGRKGEEVVRENINTSKAGFDYIEKNYGNNLVANVQKLPQTKLLIGGAEATALGAIRGGLKFAAIYPMTPINGVMTTLTDQALKYNIVVKEPEDEIAGINMALGAAFAGVRSLVATAGGGFSLMVEGLGLAAQTETPVVVIMGMRPGPATGMPTWTEQGDLRFMLHAHQGDFPRIVVAPGDPLEAFTQTMHALNLAEKYQLPVVVLVDKYLMEGHMSIDINKFKEESAKFKVERGKILTDQEASQQTDYKRYLFTEDGVSPRSLPGQQGGIGLSGSDEHDEHGLYNEESAIRTKMVDKRFKKLDTAVAANEFPQPELYTSTGLSTSGDQAAPLTLVSWGSTKMPILEAMRQLATGGVNVNFLKISYLSPFPNEAFAAMIKNTQKTLVIENNRQGQFEAIVREHTGITFTDHLRKYDGRPFYPEEIIDKVKTMV